MRRRPWEIILLTSVYLLAPFGNLVFTGLVRQVALEDWLWLVKAFGLADWINLAVWWLLAAAVWSVSRPGWWLFVALNLVQVTVNLIEAALLPEANFLLALGANVLNVAVASLLLTKHARSPYFSPRLRWWNTEVRYRVIYVLEVPLLVRQGSLEGRGLLLDLSLSGCFAELPEGLSFDEPVQLEFECWGLTIHGQGRILRQSKVGESLQGYGIQFTSMTNDQRHNLNALISTLKAHRVPGRNKIVVETHTQGHSLSATSSASSAAGGSLQ